MKFVCFILIHMSVAGCLKFVFQTEMVSGKLFRNISTELEQPGANRGDFLRLSIDPLLLNYCRYS